LQNPLTNPPTGTLASFHATCFAGGATAEVFLPMKVPLPCWPLNHSPRSDPLEARNDAAPSALSY
jgi:hypothetical protein